MIKLRGFTLAYTHAAFLILIINLVNCAPNDMLQPEAIEPYMFTTEIDGTIPILTPQYQKTNRYNQVIQQGYSIFMEKKQLQLLPQPFGATNLYCYGGNVKGNTVFSYPGPGIIAKTRVPVYVKYVNNLQGPHILPVDYTHHFRNTTAFRQEIPVIPHLHGGITQQGSDGYPQSYWTKTGARGPTFATLDDTLPSNMALFKYSNELPHGLLWYHDHAIGITRLNVYAGLAGYYEIVNPYVSSQEKNIYMYYGRVQKKYFVISDKSFKQNGELYYPDQAINPEYQTWVPEFFGNTILVNGAVWPKVTLENKKYRMIFLNACGARFLDLKFEGVNGTKLPFDLLRADSDYFNKPVTVNSYFIEPSGRIQIIIDLTDNIGTVMLRNTAKVPHPAGMPGTLIPKFTGTVMKMVVQEKFNRFNYLSSCQTTTTTTQNYTYNSEYANQTDKYPMYSSDYYHQISNCCIHNNVFPSFAQGTPVYYTFVQTSSSNGEISAVWIDGVSFHKSQQCVGRTFNLNQIYDIHFINLTPDSHPLHMHIVNFQKIAVIPFDVQAYRAAFFTQNGEIPIHGYQQFPNIFAPDNFYLGNSIQIQSIDKVFRDVTTVLPGHVTVIRVKFAKNEGCSFKTNVKGSFVFHCHMLEHQDNDMMSTMCIQ